MDVTKHRDSRSKRGNVTYTATVVRSTPTLRDGVEREMCEEDEVCSL